MKIMISSDCLRAEKLLLCLLVFQCLSCCSSLRRLDHDAIKTSRPILQVAISESDFPLFMQKIQELNFVPIDFKQGMPSAQNKETQEFWIIFRFVTKNEFLVGRSGIMSTGLVKRLITKEVE